MLLDDVPLGSSIWLNNTHSLVVGVASIIKPIIKRKFAVNQLLIRSSSSLMFFKIGVFKNLQYSQKNTCVESLFNKVAGLKKKITPFTGVLQKSCYKKCSKSRRKTIVLECFSIKLQAKIRFRPLPHNLFIYLYFLTFTFSISSFNYIFLSFFYQFTLTSKLLIFPGFLGFKIV